MNLERDAVKLAIIGLAFSCPTRISPGFFNFSVRISKRYEMHNPIIGESCYSRRRNEMHLMTASHP